MNPYHHAEASVARYGGAVEDYLAVHQWFDESKAFFPDIRHRALRHHAEGIFLCERLLGPVVTSSTGRQVPTRFLGEQHVLEDLGWIPTVQDWLQSLRVEPWMLRAGPRRSARSSESLASTPVVACPVPRSVAGFGSG